MPTSIIAKTTRYAALAVALLPLTTGICEATTIFEDTFDSGTGAWYKADTQTATTLSNSSGALSQAVGSANDMSEVIGRSFSEETIAVGETLRLTFDFTPQSAFTIIRAGFYDLDGRSATADDWSGAGPASGTWAGYTSFLRDNSATNHAARSDSGSFTGAQNIGPTMPFADAIGTSTSQFDLTNDGTVTYEGLFEFTRTSSGQIDTLFSLSTGATTHLTVAGTDTTSPLTTFDTVIFRSTAGTVEFDNIKLEVIPDEPTPMALNVGGTEVIDENTSVTDVLVGSGSDGILKIDGGDLSVSGTMSLGTSAAYRDGILEQITGTINVVGDLDFSSSALSASVWRIWNPGINSSVSVGGQLHIERAVLTMRFDNSYTHTPGSVHTLVTYGSRTGRFENLPASGEINYGANRFRIDYDADAGGGQLAITATALTNYPQPANQPNIIYIMVDDQGYVEVTPYGAPANRTPALATLASQGLLFTNGYAAASVCSPTRGGVLTGRYAESVGHRQNIGGSQEGQGLSPTHRTYMQRLASVGYKNYHVGKWFVGVSAEMAPLQRGVDYYYSITESDYQTHTAGTDYLEENGVALGVSTKYLTDHMGDQVISYIQDHLTNHPGEPFHVHWSDFAPHAPFNADPVRLETLFGVKGSYTTTEKIAAMNLAIDDNVAKLTAFLDDPDGDPETDDGIADNTIVIYTDDNGGTPSHNNGTLRGSKGAQFEGGIRVPMIVRWPDGFSPGTYTAPTHQLDWIATMCSVAGVPVAERSELDGLDLMPYIDGTEAHPLDRPLFWNLWPRWIDIGADNFAGGMRQGDWKLMVSEDLAQTELYDLAGDPSETTDIKAANLAVHDGMLETYHKWQRTNVTPQWAEQFNTDIYSRDSGLYLRALSNGYRLTRRANTAAYYTSETRPFFDLTANFSLVATITPRSPEDLNADSKAWVVFGFSEPAPTTVTSPPSPPNRAKLCRVGVDFAAAMLTIEDLDTATSSSVAMPAGWNPSAGAEIAVSYVGATRTLTLSSQASSTSIVLPAGIDEWQHLGLGVQSSEMEFKVLRDTTTRSGAAISNLLNTPGQGLRFDLEFDFPSGHPVRIESSEDLQTFETATDALIESISPGRFRVWMSNPGDPAKRFIRGAGD